MALFLVRSISGRFPRRPTLVDLLAFSRRSIFTLGDRLAEESHKLAHTKSWLARYPSPCWRGSLRRPLPEAKGASIFSGHQLMRRLLGILEDSNVKELHLGGVEGVVMF